MNFFKILVFVRNYLVFFQRDFIYIGLFVLDSVKVRFFGDKIIKVKIFFFCILGECFFVCQICNKVFNQKNVLNIYIKKYIGEKFYKCDYCELFFFQKGNLKIYIKRVYYMDMVYSMNFLKILYVFFLAGGLDEEMNVKEEGFIVEED